MLLRHKFKTLKMILHDIHYILCIYITHFKFIIDSDLNSIFHYVFTLYV